jgi:hypothetical protein
VEVQQLDQVSDFAVPVLFPFLLVKRHCHLEFYSFEGDVETRVNFDGVPQTLHFPLSMWRLIGPLILLFLQKTSYVVVDLKL